ncbi:MAG: hypothetical protein U9N36_08020 [Euryarchaeota archaeon]|nr:hypothetical protein [Euryarchaeota archaeon]
MSKTMLRIVAIAMIVLIVAFSGCLGGDKKPDEVETTPTVTPTVAPAETPVATPVATATPTVEETKTADAAEGFTPKTSDRQSTEAYSGDCKGLDQSVLRRYDFDSNGLIDSNEMEKAKIGYESNYEKPDDYNQILYAYEHQCPVEPTE